MNCPGTYTPTSPLDIVRHFYCKFDDQECDMEGGQKDECWKLERAREYVRDARGEYAHDDE